MKANNNPKNRRALIDYNKRQLELARITAPEARKRRIATNLEKWEETLTPVLKSAKPANLPKSVVNKLRGVPFKEPFEKQVIISSSEATSATFTAYSLIYALLNGGYATPSEIKTTSLMDGYNNITGMFGSREWKEYFFNNEAKVLLIEGSSKYLTRLGSKGEEQFWRELIEFTRTGDKLVIITYISDEKERGQRAFIPSLTSEREINARLLTKSVYVFLNEEEEETIKNEQAKVY